MSEAADFTETVDVTFHSISYLLTISTVNGDTLCLEVEQKSDASRWRGDFTSRYIEDITAKTGNYKKFPVFVKMLLSAVKQASESVFVDLLTYQDLEVLKARKAGNAAAGGNTQPGTKGVIPSNKRYLILTYAAEFDRVHYPLPLLYEEAPDPARLKAIIVGLRAELDTLAQEHSTTARRGVADATTGSHELRRMREENAALRQQLKQLERVGLGSERLTGEAQDLARELKLVRKERDLLQARLETAEAELEREKGLHRRELRRKAKETQEAYDELGKSREQIRELKAQVRQLAEELDAASRRTGSLDRIRAVYGRPSSATAAGDAYYGSRSQSNGRSGSGAAGYGRSGSGGGDRGLPRPSSAHLSRGGQYGYSGSGSGRHEGPPRSRAGSAGASPSSSRPNSAPAGRSGVGRFDPTEYVRQKQQALQDRRLSGGSAGSSRAPTPPRSGASSPAPSRPGSAERGRQAAGLPGNRGLSPMSNRADSIGRGRSGSGAAAGAGGRGVPGYDRLGRPLTVDTAAVGSRSRGSSPASGRAAWGAGGAGGEWSKFPPITGAAGGRSGNGVGASNSRPQSAERSTSPGRALQEVKKKLSEYVNKRSTDDLTPSNSTAAVVSTTAAPPPRVALSTQSGNSTAPAGPPSSAGAGLKTQLFEDASAEIADIDSRLHALQSFLKMAKSGAIGSVASQAPSLPSSSVVGGG